jgi:hypothetical protein
MSLATVIKGLLEPISFDISSLVNLTNADGSTANGPARVKVAASVPLTGSVAKSTAGAAAPDQTLKTFSSSGGVSIATGATVNLYTVSAGKTFYITDIVLTGNATTPTQYLVQIKAGATVIWEGYVKTDTEPIEVPGLETQPQGAGGSQISIVFATASGTTATYYVAGYEQ